ncbi:MAG: FtsX-like permease family protein [Acidimicrobiia bacterium]
MKAVRMLARAQIRRRWGSIAVLTLLVGFVGVVVLASVAGARRTATSLERFEERYRSADIEFFAGDTTPEQLQALRATPGVAAVGVLRQLQLFQGDAGFLPTGGQTDHEFGRTVDRARIVAGREAHGVHELTIGEGLAGELGLGVGDRLPFESLAPDQVDGDLASDFDPQGPRVAFRIVGIVRRPLDLGSSGAGGGVIVPTRAFVEAYEGRIASFTDVLRVRTEHGDADVPPVIDAARKIFRLSSFRAHGLASEGQGAQSAIDVTTVAIWILAGIAALAGLVAIALALARHMAQVAVDQDTLRAFGLRRRERWAAAFGSAVPIAAGGALLAVVGAALASPLFPIGVARDADPAPGFDLDWVALTAGFLTVVSLVAAASALAAVVATARHDPDFSRPALPTQAASRAGIPPAMATGIGFALERGHGRGGVPVRSSLAGASFGVLAVVAALLFAASLDRLVTTPRLFGWSWDVVTTDPRWDNEGCARGGTRLAEDPMIAAVAGLCYGDIEIDGRPAVAFGVRPVRGAIGPTVVEGRAPRSEREVALGAYTLDAAGKDVGDVVQVRSRSRTRRYRVVGRAVFATILDPQPLADGAAFTAAGMERANAVDDGYLVVRLAPGVNRARALAHLERIARPTGFEPVVSAVPAEVDRLRQIDLLPAALAAFVAFVALVAVGYALVTAVQRRRRDLAILKTLGYRRAQVRATVAWHATTVAVIGLAVGIPLGIVVGRVVWRWVADDLGVSTNATVPMPALLVLVAAAILLVNLIAAVPARAAARTRPAVVLRSE